MQLERERAQIVEYAQRMRGDGLVIGTSGNISARDGDLVAMTPSGLDYDDMRPELIAVVTLGGEQVDGDLAPTSEIAMHLAVYERTDARAAVHTHAPYATVLGTVLDEVPPIHYMMAECGGPVRVAPYATYGTPELAEFMGRALDGRSVALLANHGTIAVGDSVATAYERTVLLEWLCALYFRARQLGEPRLLTDEQIRETAEKLAEYGQTAPEVSPSTAA